MKAKEFMQQVHHAEIELRMIEKKRRHFQELATNIGVNLTGMPGGGQQGSSRVETGAIGLVDLMAGLDKKAAEYAALITKAEDLIDKIPQDNFRKVLTLRYILGESWKTIVDEMEYKDEKSAYRCHGYALKELQNLM